MKINPKLLVLLTIALGGLAYAAANVVPQDGAFWFRNGIWILPKSLNTSVTSAQKLTRAPGCDLDYDFPALGPDGKVGGGASTWAKTCTGAQMGDACSVGSKAYADGGVPVDVLLNCFVTAPDTVVVHAHSLVNDAGELNPVDAGYHVRLFSNQ